IGHDRAQHRPSQLCIAARDIAADAGLRTEGALGDRDTACAIVGGSCTHSGSDGIPQRWLRSRRAFWVPLSACAAAINRNSISKGTDKARADTLGACSGAICVGLLAAGPITRQRDQFSKRFLVLAPPLKERKRCEQGRGYVGRTPSHEEALA